MTTNKDKLQTLAVAFLLGEAERYLARSLEGYRRACILDAQSGECAAGYDDAYDDLGRCTDTSLQFARDIIATDPAPWHAAIIASETDTGLGAYGVEVMCRTLGACIATGQTEDNVELAYCGPLLRSDAAGEWFRRTASACDAATSERLARENEEKDEN